MGSQIGRGDPVVDPSAMTMTAHSKSLGAPPLRFELQGRPAAAAAAPKGGEERRSDKRPAVSPASSPSDLGRRRAVARDVGRRRKRAAAHRSRERGSSDAARHAARNRRLGARVGRRRHVLPQRRRQRHTARGQKAEMKADALAPAGQRPLSRATGGAEGAERTSPLSKTRGGEPPAPRRRYDSRPTGFITAPL